MAQKGDFNRKIGNWMAGRNGVDALANASTFFAIVFYALGLLSGVSSLIWIALVLLAYAFFRMTSKNIASRARENESFLASTGSFGSWFVNPSAAWHELRSYRHFKCPNCHQRVRIPRGKGKIRVTCPKCHQKFEAKS